MGDGTGDGGADGKAAAGSSAGEPVGLAATGTALEHAASTIRATAVAATTQADHEPFGITNT
jgi:hypothetical protein